MSLHDVDSGLGQAYGTADLVEAVRTAGLQPRDPRVRTTWELLRARGVLSRELWVRRLLRRIWQQGLPPGNRPRTAARLDAALRGWGLPGVDPSSAATAYPGAVVYPAPVAYPVAPYYPGVPYYPRRDHRHPGPWRPPHWPRPRPVPPPRYYRTPAWRR